MSTPVHHAINIDVIPRLRGPVLKMTASFNRQLNKRAGVTKTETDTIDSKTIAKCQIGSEIITVGIDDDMKRHMPGALVTGLNLKVTSVIDTGRRIDPSYENGALTITERVSSSLELTQSIGRLNRRASDGPGRFIYNSNPRVNSCKSNNVNYYALIYTALHTMFCRPDVKDQYGPILSGQSTKWIVPLNPGPRSNDHRSFRSYNSGKSNASQRKPITNEVVPVPVINKRVPSTSKEVATTRTFSINKSHWWSHTPPPIESGSAGQKAEILYEEIMNMLTEFNGLERSFNVSSSQVQDANRALNGQVPLYTNDEIGAMIVIARRYIETRVGKHNTELLNNLRDYFLSAMMCRKMEL
ncbi:hypothetical protein O181_069732 [Austropuccinia psidii MF-1]|uniref:Uncharacterized protein n=1 Tax=Austropuccinia psidii MF-1 TaxID=1389203 RepID=A0A9Q3F1V3_9BASI|nr:hypothetical protein [Austropuccinia psidii MF-1]